MRLTDPLTWHEIIKQEQSSIEQRGKSMATEKRLFFLGAGSIAEAMIKGIVGARVVPAEQIVVSNRKNGARLEELRRSYGVRVCGDKLAEVARAEVVVLAMKPFDVMQALQEVRGALSERQLVVSVVAGVFTGGLRGRVGGVGVRGIRRWRIRW